MFVYIFLASNSYIFESKLMTCIFFVVYSTEQRKPHHQAHALVYVSCACNKWYYRSTVNNDFRKLLIILISVCCVFQWFRWSKQILFQRKSQGNFPQYKYNLCVECVFKRTLITVIYPSETVILLHITVDNAVRARKNWKKKWRKMKYKCVNRSTYNSQS